MQTWFPLLPTIGQVLIGFYFFFFGLWNIYHWTPILEGMIRKNIPYSFFFLTLGISLQIITGTMIIFGILVKLAALLLIPYTIIGVFIFHDFWNYKGIEKRLNLHIFIGNLTITLGALFHLLQSSVPVSQVTQQLT